MSLSRSLSVNMAMLTVARVFTLILSLASTAVLTRYLGPASFGEFRTVMAFLGLAILIANLGVHLIFVREFSRPESDQVRLLGNALTLRTISAAVILLAAAGLAFAFPYNPIIRWGILLSTPGFVALAAFQLLQGVFQQKLRQLGAVIAEVSGSLLVLALLLLLTQLGASLLAVLGVFVLGNLLTLGLGLFFANRLTPVRPRWEWGEWRALLIPAIPVAGGSILNLLYYRTDTIALSLFRPAAEVGLYGVAIKLTDAIVGIALLFVGLVMPVLSRHAGRDPIAFQRHLGAGFDVIAIGVVGAAAMLCAFADPIVKLVAGDGYGHGAWLLQALCPIAILYPICTICRYACTALNQQGWLLWGYAAAVVIGLAAMVLLVPAYGGFGTALGLFASESAVFITALWVLRRERVAIPSFVTLAKALACGAVAIWVANLPPISGMHWLLALPLTGLLYLTLLLAISGIRAEVVTVLLVADGQSANGAARPRPLPERPFSQTPVLHWFSARCQNHVVSQLLAHDAIERALVRRVGWTAQQIVMYLAGCVLFSLGVKLFIDASLGVDPLHSMVIGFVNWIDLPLVRIGFVASLVTLLFLAVWSAWNRRLPPLSTFVTMALVGYLVDLWNAVGLEGLTANWLPAVPMMLLALVIDGYASALIIMSGIGVRVMDLLALTFVKRLRWSFLASKLMLEIGFVVVAWLHGGPVGVGTLAFVAVIGTIIPPFMWANSRFLNLPNHGLGRRSRPARA
jgi:O-antigen/teichoic acid export membrane protein/uncharacterized membrane protein YczE